MVSKMILEEQIKQCKGIVEAIKKGNYMDASIRIRYNLNAERFVWYKDIESIINDQITNLFFDIENNFEKNLTIDFFEHLISEMKWDIEHGFYDGGKNAY